MLPNRFSLLLLCGLLLLVFILLSCKWLGKKDKPAVSIKNNPNQTMPISTLPITGDYTDEWKIVDSLEQQGLFKSALEKVEAIQKRASGDKNSQQTVKCLIFIGKYTAQMEEDGLAKAIQTFEKEAAGARQPERSLMQSLLGQLYATYLQNNSWQLRNRTPIPDGEGGDILTWSAAQIEKQALELYSTSLKEEALLSTVPLSEFKDVLQPTQHDSVMGQPLWSNLFELLAQRAITHFSNERSYLSEPAYAFVLNQPEAFTDWETFKNTAFETKDTDSGKWRAIQLFQRLYKLFKINPNGDQTVAKARLFDLELKRMNFVFTNSVLENQNDLYRSALEKLKIQSENHPSHPEIVFYLADHVFRLETANKAENAIFAVKELEKVVKQYPNAYGTKQCEQLLAEIKSTSIVLNVEKVNLPDQHILTSVQYANLSKVFVRVVPSHISNEFEVDNDGLYDRLLAEKPIQTREWTVQNPGDYQQHTTELAVNPLPFGSYWLLMSDNAAFDRTKGPVAFSNFFVSNLSGAPINENGKIVHVVTDRREGAPLANVKMDYYTYDYNSGRRKTIHAGSGTTDQNGYSRFKSPDNQYLMVRASLGKDSLWIGQSYNYNQRINDRVYQYVHFFTDRSLYRPGQTVYFKGLLFEKTSNGIPEIIANQYVTVTFNDVNGQKKGELRLKSNEYGTFNGAFTAPSTGLMGAMTITAREGGNGSTQVQVEEYKRPRFEVTTKPVEGSYRLNEKITLSGEAKNYAGNAVDGAQVRYRVVREARFPFFDFYRRWIWPPMPASPAQEIASGTTTSDADGAYKIEFQAIPDLKIKKKDQPVFDYQVYIDVTDITGETRSTTAQVSAGYAALQVNWALSNEADIETMRKIELGTSNMSGQAQAAEGQITMQRLVEPKQFYVSRYWNRPDITTIAQTDFQRMFPDFAWKDEDEPEKWGRQDFTRTIKFNTATQKTVDLHEGKTQPGWYILKLTTKDSYGEEIEIQKVVRVYDEKSRFEAPFAQAVQASVEPGQTAKILMGGKPANLHFFFARDNEGVMQDMRWVKSNGASQSIEFAVKESDRGGIPYVCFAIKNNRFYALSNQIAVPWSNKQLQISFETFRDKLSPGQKEEWRIKISGPKKEKVAAELTAAMYDASLDAFKPHSWNELGYPYRNAKIFIVQPEGYQAETGMVLVERPDFDVPYRIYPEVNWFLFPLWMNYAPGRPMMSRAAGGEPLMMKSQPAAPADEQFMDASMAISEESAGKPAEKEEAEKPAYPASIRRNLNETVFFFPDLHTDADGNVILKFTMNEALTRWKLLTYAHTQDLKQAVAVKEVVTQKELMVIANPPRFLREGDEMEFSAKVSNLSQEQLEGTASLNLLDAATLQSVEKLFGLAPNNRIARFSVLPGQSAAVSWRFKVPENYNGAVTWQIFADGKAFRDGEESTIPVVSNRMLVTETMPISLRGNQTKKFVFENFKQGGTSTSLVTHNYTLEFTSNPAWYVVQSLPYLMEYPHECSEQIFSRYYANTLASSVVNKMPQVKKVFDRWQGTDAMLSNLSKNQELKYALLEETPWVLDAQSEEQQRKNIALLFDLNRMANEQEKALRILQERQQGNGGWAWFPGSAPSWYITQYIATGLMHLQKLGAVDLKKDKSVSNMLDKALGFCDEQLKKQYAELEKAAQKGQIKLEDDHLDGMSIQYLYLRSFSPLDRPAKEVAYYLGQADKYWLGKGLYQEGMLALALHRWGNKTTAQKITASLRERATLKEELGMYWPVQWGFYWYQLPIETQALMVEVFGEVANDAAAVENLRIWLLKNKQTNRWESTKATAEAAYALLLFGENWLENTKPVQVSMSGKPLKVNEYEAGTGYFKQSWTGAQVEPSWAEIKVENPNSNIVWGAAYWQYFEDLDKIKDFKKTPLTIVKQLFLEENSPSGPVLKPISEGQALHRGDKVKVRVEIRVDRPMEFVHLKDMRAAGLEPVNVLSGYRYQGGLGYYESTKDLATHFFIDYLPRGTFVFEYPLVVSNRGNMSNGITTMQCMYAPEFTSHSKGIRIKVE